MRFRKSIRLAKGLRLNLSKSGLSLTAGVRGASLNFGPRGTYMNTGIPGTGLYNRKRIDSGLPRSKPAKEKIYIDVNIKIDDTGQPIIKDHYGDPILDEALLRKIKKTPEYKQKLEELVSGKKREVENNTSAFIHIFKFTPVLLEIKTIEQELKEIKIETYEVKPFSTPRPEIDGVRSELAKKAKQEIKSVFFWTLKKKRAEYVDQNIQFEYDAALNRWLSDKETFEKAEAGKKEQEDGRLLAAFESRKNELKNFLSGAEYYVHSQIDSFLKSLSLPVDFSLNYDYEQEKGILMVDLDVPEIEDLPKDKANLLLSGKLSIKSKTQKELKEDYVRCVVGLAFFFAGSFFNISTNITKILVSGYTQRIDNKSGALEDQYIYSVAFDRSKFAELSIKHIEPLAAVSNFRHILDITKTFEMKTIEPLTVADL